MFGLKHRKSSNRFRFDVLDIYSRAFDRYHPQPCSARSILVKGRNRYYHSQSDWGQVLVGDCEEHVVNASHEQIREAPYVHLWAEKLKSVLSSASFDLERANLVS